MELKNIFTAISADTSTDIGFDNDVTLDPVLTGVEPEHSDWDEDLDDHFWESGDKQHLSNDKGEKT